MTGPVHSDRAHASLGASSCKRWWNCPGSVRLSENIPKTSSKYADEGTAAHEVAEMCLRDNRDAIEYIGRFITVHGNKFEVDEGMAEAVQVYVDFVREAAKEGELRIEQKVDLAALNPPVPMFGTTDAVVLKWIKLDLKPDAGILKVIDYKHGAGVAVDVDDFDDDGVNHGNKQGRYYALGTWLGLPKEQRDLITEVEVVIVQPRAYHADGAIRTERLTIAELKAWARELKKHALATLAPDAPLVSGSHCRFCPAEAVCPQRACQALVVVQDAFDDLTELEQTPAEAVKAKLPIPQLLKPAQIAAILNAAPAFRAYVEACEEHAFQLLNRGEEVPGFKLVPKRAKRDWNRVDEVHAALLLLHGYDDDQIFEPKTLRSPAQIEKLMGKKVFANEMSGYVVKISSGLTVAPASDKREAEGPSIDASAFPQLSAPSGKS